MVLSAIFVAVSLFIPMISANMKLLIPIRKRLDDLRKNNNISQSQYQEIVHLASNEMLDADIEDHDMNYISPSLSDKVANYFCGWINEEEDQQRMTEDTSDYIRNLFDLGDSPNRPMEQPQSRHNGAVEADYEGNGMSSPMKTTK